MNKVYTKERIKSKAVYHMVVSFDYTVLECAYKLLSKPGKWTKGALAKKRVSRKIYDAKLGVYVNKRVLESYDPKTGNAVGVFDSGVQNYCLLGALIYCAGPENAQTIPATGDIFLFNDHMSTKKKDVLDAIKEAMEIKIGGLSNV